MPELTGDEVLTRIREEGPKCSVIIASAVDPGSEPLAADSDEYLNKPISATELRKQVERLLQPTFIFSVIDSTDLNNS